MHSSNSSPPTSRRRGQHPGSFFTIPRWMGGGGGSGSKKQLQYRSLRSLEDPTSSASAASATGRRKRPSLFDQMVKRFFTPHVGHHRNGTSEATWNGGGKYSAPSRSGSLRDLRTRAVGGDPGGGDDTFFAGNGAKRRPEDAGPRTPVPAVAGIRNEATGTTWEGPGVAGVSRRPRRRLASRNSWRKCWEPCGRAGPEGDFAARFKSCVEKHGSQYQGSEQHDAQEFLIWLLDKVHEELLADDATATTSSSGSSTTSNAASRSRRGSLKRSKSRSSSVKVGGATPWQGSPVASLFAGQLRLRLTCPRCGQQSNTFDPFVCLSLPIPAASQWLCHVHFVPRNSPPTKLAFHMDFGAPVEQVRLRIAAECHIPPDQLLLLEETKEGFGSLFEGDEIASALSVNSRLVALELPPASTDPAVPKDSQILVFCRSRVGASGSWLDVLVWGRKPETSGRRGPPSLSGVRGLPAGDVQGPCTGAHSPSGAPVGAPCRRPVVSWLKIPSWTMSARISRSREPSVSLSDCLAFYFTEEKLEPEEAWLCPQCDSRQQGFAQLGLWFCPEILVIHLKRFHQNGGRHSKLATRVEIPFQDLDLSNHLCKGASGSGSVLYDLYAFCSHHGTGLQGGHYTACCKNPVDEQWYLFDDARDAVQFSRTLVHENSAAGEPEPPAPFARLAVAECQQPVGPRRAYVTTSLVPERQLRTDAGALSPGSPPSLRDFSPPAGTTSFMDSSTSSDITPSPVENRSLTPSPGRALDFPTEKLNRISPPPKVSPKKSSPTRVTTRGSGFRPRPTYLSTSPTKGSPKKYSVSPEFSVRNVRSAATSPITMTTKPWSGYNTVPAKSASDVDTSRTGRVALLAAKFSQPAGASAPSSKWPCKFPDVDDLEHTLPGRGSRGTCSPMNGDDDSFVSVNGAVYPSQTLNRSPVPLSPETLNRRVLSPRVTRSSRPVRNLNGSFDYEQDVFGRENKATSTTEDVGTPSELKEAFWTITSV
ncbi:hypothetical protein MRX96_018080 [Rhipicephalus microplus]